MKLLHVQWKTEQIETTETLRVNIDMAGSQYILLFQNTFKGIYVIYRLFHH